MSTRRRCSRGGSRRVGRRSRSSRTTSSSCCARCETRASARWPRSARISGADALGRRASARAGGGEADDHGRGAAHRSCASSIDIDVGTRRARRAPRPVAAAARGDAWRAKDLELADTDKVGGRAQDGQLRRGGARVRRRGACSTARRSRRTRCRATRRSSRRCPIDGAIEVVRCRVALRALAVRTADMPRTAAPRQPTDRSVDAAADGSAHRRSQHRDEAERRASAWIPVAAVVALAIVCARSRVRREVSASGRLRTRVRRIGLPRAHRA